MVLNNINGEYVKFYYTTNSILPQTLKRTGAIVIYDNKNFHKEKINNYDLSYNSIYLGGELIIGGIGFSDLRSREQAIKILGEWDGFKASIDQNFNKLNEDIINALNVDLSGTEAKVSGDNLINKSDKKEFYIHQAIFDTIESQYKPAEILDEVNKIEYFELGNWGNHEGKITVSSHNNEPIDLPIGAQVYSVSKKVKIKLNDDRLASISGSYIYYNKQNWEEFLNNSYNKGVSVTFASNNGTSSNNDIVNIELIYNYENNSNNRYYVSEKPNQTILTYNSLFFIGTDINNDNIIKELSYYNVSTGRVENTGVKSIKNVVLEHRHFLNDIIINPKPFIFYYNYSSSSKNNNISTYTVFNYGDRKILSNKTTDILIKSGTTKFIFGIPKNYIINDIYYYEDYNNINVKTNITSLFVKLDITELNSEEQNPVKKSFINLYANKEYILKDGYEYNGKLNSNDNRYFEYDFYSIDFGNNKNFNTDVTIYIDFDNFQNKNITLLSKKDIVDSDSKVNLNFDKQNGANNWMMLHNDMYLSSNWLSGIDKTNYNNILGYKLKYLQISSEDYNKIFNYRFNENNLKKYYNDSRYSKEMPVFNIDTYDYYKYNEIKLVNNSVNYPYLIIDDSFNESIYIYDKNNYDRLDTKLTHKYIGNYIFTKFYELNFKDDKLDNINLGNIDFELLKFVSFDIVDPSKISRNEYISNKKSKSNLDKLEYKFLDTKNRLDITINDTNVLNNYFIPNDFSSNEYKVYTNIYTNLKEKSQSNENTVNLGKYSLYIIIPRSIPLNIKFNYKLYNDEYETNPEVENFKTDYIYISNFIYKNVKYNIYEFTGDLDYTITTIDGLNRYILDNITITKK